MSVFLKCCMIAVLAAGCFAVRAEQTVAMGRRYISADEVGARYGMIARDFRSSVEIAGGGRRLVLYPDKRYALINGVRYSLSFAPLRQGKLFLSQIDMLCLLDPVLGRRSVPKHELKVIALDAGHGGKDQGGAGRLYKEKSLTLQIAERVRTYLQRAGYTVIMTRRSDVYLTLAQRPDLADRFKADIFVSIHTNAAADRTVQGIETYTLSPQNAPSDSGSKPVPVKYAGNEFDNNSMALGHNIHRFLLAKTKAADRGLRRARFVVIRDVHCPAVLLELGFISHAEEERKLGSAVYQDALARGIAEGILQYNRTLLLAK